MQKEIKINHVHRSLKEYLAAGTVPFVFPVFSALRGGAPGTRNWGIKS